MNPRLLMSLYRVTEAVRETCLLRVDPDTAATEWVDVGYAGSLLRGGTGLCCDDAHVYHLSIAHPNHETCLSVLDRASLRPLHVQTLEEVADGHSLAYHDGELFVVSTGTEQVVAYRISGHKPGGVRLVWSPTGAETDTQHVNSLTFAGNDLLCSAFGPRDNDAWYTATRGYIVNATSGSLVREHIRQPHTLVWSAGTLYFCESERGVILSDDRVVARVPGYARGLAFGSGGTLYAGASRGRRRPGVDATVAPFGNPRKGYDPIGRCALTCIDGSTARTREMDMSTYGDEIYDLLAI